MSTALAPRVETPVVALQHQPAPRFVGLLRPIADPEDVLVSQEQTRTLVAKVLTSGRDYGKIPGVKKEALFKAGAERVVLAFGCYFGDPEIIEREIDHDREVHWTKQKRGEKPRTGISYGLYRYVVRVPIIHRETGAVVGYGIASASTMESKYVENPRDAENTALKMAHKRAIVGGALVTFGLSDQFTQDVEDLPSAAQAEQDGAAYAEEEARELTLEEALVMPFPLPGNKYHRKPFSEVSAKMLQRAEEWLVKKIEEEGETPSLVRTLMATRLVLAGKAAESGRTEKPETPAPAAESVAAEEQGIPAAEVAATPAQTEREQLIEELRVLLRNELLDQGEALATMREARKQTVEQLRETIAEIQKEIAEATAEIEQGSKRSLTKRLNALLEHPAIPADVREATKRALINGLDADGLRKHIQAAKSIINSAAARAESEAAQGEAAL